MKITDLTIQNFRGLRSVQLSDLKNVVIIAGPNGCGKSCILEALRILKTTYGEYDSNEYQQWMNELQVRPTRNMEGLAHLFYDKSQPIQIRATFALHPDEVNYLSQNAETLARDLYWRGLNPNEDSYYRSRSLSLASQIRAKEPEVERKAQEAVKELRSALKQPRVSAGITIRPDGKVMIAPSGALEILFSTFEPGRLGIVDYHGPQRLYNRESVTNVNLSLEDTSRGRSQHSLYNYSSKYSGVKSEMAGLYIRDILGRAASGDTDRVSPLIDTMKVLFETFFPDKEFLGPVPSTSGHLSFPVRLKATGATHDLDELSAGEKEIIYGYLRLRSSAPRFSVILIDEPELHLNPALIRHLPRFYHDYLSHSLDNQIWFVTHSDALIRDAVGQPSYSVFHMSPSTSVGERENQAKLIKAEDEFEALVVDVVGDLAAYRPGKDMLVFEGGNSNFDQRMTLRLFPEIQGRINVTSLGSKSQVQQFHAAFEKLQETTRTPFQIFSIVDKDGGELLADPPYRMVWDVYHIENYLLDSDAIFEVLSALGIDTLCSPQEVDEEIVRCARASIGPLVADRLRRSWSNLGEGLQNWAFNPQVENISDEFLKTVKLRAQRFNKIVEQLSTSNTVAEQEAAIRADLELEIADGRWRSTFRGRDILKHFVSQHCDGTPYTKFRFLVIDKLAAAGRRPSGMAQVIETVLSSDLPQ